MILIVTSHANSFSKDESDLKYEVSHFINPFSCCLQVSTAEKIFAFRNSSHLKIGFLS